MVNPNEQSLELIGGEVGVLILTDAQTPHGLSLTWAASLHEAGSSVSVPALLPAVSSWQEINHDQWLKWLASAEDALASLKSHCSTIFIVGISMASTIALRLAENQGNEIDGVILLEPSLPDARMKLRKIWKTIDDGFHAIDQPLILLYSLRAGLDYSENAVTISNNVTSPFIRDVVLENSFQDLPIILKETTGFINEVANGFWFTDIPTNDETDLIDAEFQSIVAGLSLDESAPSNFLDDLEREDPEEHFQKPDPILEPIGDSSKRNALLMMVLGPIYAITAAIIGFNPFGIEPWPGILAFLGGLASFFYHLHDGYSDDDGAIL